MMGSPNNSTDEVQSTSQASVAIDDAEATDKEEIQSVATNIVSDPCPLRDFPYLLLRPYILGQISFIFSPRCYI